MSEAEKIKRLNYKRSRRRWIIFQAIIISLLLLAVIASSAVYYRLNRTYYIGYNESGSADYKVQYIESEEYGDWIEDGQSYISALVSQFLVQFDYELNMDAENVDYEYSYKVGAQLMITDRNNKLPIYAPIDDIVEEKSFTQSSNKKLAISENVFVDFAKYNRKAQDFISFYGLTDVTSSLIVKMSVNVIGDCEEFEENSKNSYFVALNIPLTQTTFNVSVTESAPSDSKVLARESSINQNIFAIIAKSAGFADILLIAILIIFIYSTRNEDINYTIKVKKIVSAYKSFIQKINNRFDEAGYQLLMVSSFNEMLDIRDTIQSPILMNENEDMTLTRFYIPTNTKILYVFEIKVDNYDELYGLSATAEDAVKAEDTDESAESATEETAEADVTEAAVIEDAVEVVIAEETAAEAVVAGETVAEEVTETVVDEETVAEDVVAEEAVAEAVVAEEAVAEEGSAPVLVLDSSETSLPEPPIAITADDDAVRLVNGVVVHIRYRTSFMSRLIQSEASVQDYYTVLKNYLLSYKGIKARTSWNFESFNKGRLQCAKLNVKGNTLLVYLALSPSEYNANKYYFTDVSDKPKLNVVPMMLKIKSERALKYAFELIDEVMNKNGIEKSATVPELDYRMPYETTEALVDKGYVKVILPDGITVDENTLIEKININELLKFMKQSSGSKASIDDVMEQAMSEPDVELSEIDYVDVIDEVYEETEEKPGVDVISVVWPEKAHKNKVYRYDPNGHTVEDGDEVLVPTKDASKNREVIRKAAVAHGNHKIDPDTLQHPLKKIICVVRRRVEKASTEDN